jgi:hypothetical protein
VQQQQQQQQAILSETREGLIGADGPGGNGGNNNHNNNINYNNNNPININPAGGVGGAGIGAGAGVVANAELLAKVQEVLWRKELLLQTENDLRSTLLCLHVIQGECAAYIERWANVSRGSRQDTKRALARQVGLTRARMAAAAGPGNNPGAPENNAALAMIIADLENLA